MVQVQGLQRSSLHTENRNRVQTVDETLLGLAPEASHPQRFRRSNVWLARSYIVLYKLLLGVGLLLYALLVSWLLYLPR